MLKTKLAALTVAAGTALAIAPSAHAATDYFMRIDPTAGDQQIQGESNDVTFQGTKGWTEINSFSMGVENPTTIGSQTGGAGVGKAKFDELEINKDVDSTTPQIWQRMAQGKHFAGIEIVARKAGATPSAVIPIRYYFALAYPTADQQSGSSSDDTTQEKLTFVFGGLAQKYVGQTPSGTAKTPVFGTWDQLTNAASFDTTMPVPSEVTS
jgi:type VI secretion system secreted protein Hcp